MTFILAIVGGKGGGGKSTIACNLNYRSSKEKPTLHLDLDFPQHTSYKFFVERRKFNGLEPLNIIKMKPEDLTKEKILEFAETYERLIIEYGKGVEESMKWVMKFANKLMMVLQPTGFEHESIGDIELEFHQEGSKDIPCTIVVNRTPNVARYNNWIKTEPLPTYFKFSENYISNLSCMADSSGIGKSVLELPRKDKSTIVSQGEIELLYNETF
jgi:MinD superfamily P-loop ATPase